MMESSPKYTLTFKIALSLLAVALLMISLSLFTLRNEDIDPVLDAAWSSKAQPFSTVDPASLGFAVVDRPFRFEFQLATCFGLVSNS